QDLVGSAMDPDAPARIGREEPRRGERLPHALPRPEEVEQHGNARQDGARPEVGGAGELDHRLRLPEPSRIHRRTSGSGGSVERASYHETPSASRGPETAS